MRKVGTLTLLVGCVILAGATHAIADGSSPGLAQVVALDECDPVTFNAAVGPDFCKNVTLGAFTTLSDLFAGAEAGTPDPGWDFEPDKLTINKGTILSVVDQGGEPHTFTEVKEFGNGFIPQLNPGSATSVIPECKGGFSNIEVARTRILQGSHLDITGLSKGKHLFECCIHPWMRIEVDVSDPQAASAGSITARGCSQSFHPNRGGVQTGRYRRPLRGGEPCARPLAVSWAGGKASLPSFPWTCGQPAVVVVADPGRRDIGVKTAGEVLVLRGNAQARSVTLLPRSAFASDDCLDAA